MKYLIFLILLIPFLSNAQQHPALGEAGVFKVPNNNRIRTSELSLYDSDGSPRAYINLRGLTIYLWGGTPVAYLCASTKNENPSNCKQTHIL